MSNLNNNIQTQTSNTLHNAIMEAGSKDRPPMLAPGNYVQWKSRIKRYIDTKPNHELIYYCLENPPYVLGWKDKPVLDSEGSPTTTTERVFEMYKNVKQDIRDQLNAEAKAVQIILTGIDNDIYSTVDACPNACEMWKAIERLKHGESINVQDLETNLYWEFRKFTSQDGESLESYYSRFYKMMNELIRNQCKVTNHQVNVQFLLQLQPEWQRLPQAATRNRGKTIVNSPQPIYDQEPFMVDDDDETSKDKEIDKLMALISLSFKKIYKPTNNNLRTSSNTSRANQDNSLRINRNAGYESQRIGNVAGARETVGSSMVLKSGIQCYNCKEFRHVARECQKPKWAKDAAYHKEKMLLCKQEEAGIQLNAEQADWKDDTDDESDDQELEAHYMYMAKIQEVSPDAVDSRPIFDTEPEQNEQIDQNDEDVDLAKELDVNSDSEQIDQNDKDVDLAKERELLASLIEKLKCEIDESKNRNKILETSNKVLIDKLKSEIKDFKNKNNSLELSNNQFKEANNKLSEENDLLYADFKKSQAEPKRRDSIEYASEMELECAKVRGKSVDTKFEKSLVIQQLNAFKSQRPSVLGKPTTFSNSFVRKDFSKSMSVTQTNVSNDFSKPVTAQTLPLNKKSILKNMNVLAPGMYKIHTDHNQTSTSQLPQDSRKTNKRKSFSTEVIPTTSVSRPHLKSNPQGDRVMHNNSQRKKQVVEDQRRSVKLSKNKTSVTACNDSLNAKTLNVKFVSAMDNHNLFSVGQFYDTDLEVAFRKSTCFIRDLKGNDLLTGSHRTDLYSITLQDTNCPNLICLMAKATSSQAWLWHRRLSHLNFNTINLLSKNDIVVGIPKLKFVKDHLCSSCKLGKAKRKSFHTKLTPSSKRRLQLLHMDLCGPMRVASINGKIYVLVIVDDYSRYTWTYFLRSKDETPEVLINFLRLVQRGLQAQVRVVRTEKGMEFFNQTLYAYFAAEGILHQTSVARTPEQNGAVERRNRTLVEAARTMLSAAKVPLFFWAEAIATACFPQNQTYAENDQVADDEFINIFCTPVQDQGETLSRHVDSLNMHTFYQRYPSKHHWTKDYPLEQVIGNPL
nr:retrovirus-related Pol polyprotein from transposon TNT 1-94 [Tanacetum cinerariifolium]